MMLEPMGLAAGPVVPTREWRELYAALDCAVVAAIHPFYTASVREFKAAGRPVVGSAPVGLRWHRRLAARHRAGLRRLPQSQIDVSRNQALPQMRGAAAAKADLRSHHAQSGYEGSELLVARLLIECGADLRYVGSACPAHRWSECRRHRMARRPRACKCNMRASLEQDLARHVRVSRPDLAIGTTPVVQNRQAKQRCRRLYFTNLISARPLMGVAGAGSLAQVVQRGHGQPKSRFDAMKDFFGDVGAGHAAGVWEVVPKDRPEFRGRDPSPAGAAAEEAQSRGDGS
jgi:chlorophyllide a reductase subunit Y